MIVTVAEAPAAGNWTVKVPPPLAVVEPKDKMQTMWLLRVLSYMTAVSAVNPAPVAVHEGLVVNVT